MRPVKEEIDVSQLGCSAGGGALLVILLAALARPAVRSGWEPETGLSSGVSDSESDSLKSAGGAQRKKLPTLPNRTTCQAEYRQILRKRGFH